MGMNYRDPERPGRPIDWGAILPPAPKPTRWATPYITRLDGQDVHACALRLDVDLSHREVLAGCLSIVYAETAEGLQTRMDREDKKSAEVLARPPMWAEGNSGTEAWKPCGGASSASGM